MAVLILTLILKWRTAIGYKMAIGGIKNGGKVEKKQKK